MPMVWSWVDDSANTTSENLGIQANLRQKVGQLQIFDQTESFERSLNQNTKENVFLITNNKFGQILLPKIHQKTNLISCLIFCQDRTRAKEWSASYEKVNHQQSNL